MITAYANFCLSAALSGSVRPVITYLFVPFYFFVKITTFLYALRNGVAFQLAVESIYTQQDNLLFTSVVSFWFGSRQFAKLRNNKK